MPNNSNKIKVLLIGPSPRNIGGISIHLKRLIGLLKDKYDFSIVDEGHTRYRGEFNLRTLNLVMYYKLLFRADIVHIHSGVFILRFFHIINSLLLHKKTIVTIHRDPRIEGHATTTRFLLGKCDHAILVNKEGYDAVRKSGKCQYHLLPAFLPPLLDEEPSLPSEILDWIGSFKKNNGAYICCSNAWNLVFHNNEDLYGLDICLKAINRLCVSGFRNVGLVFVVASCTAHAEVLDAYKKYISDNHLENNILIWEHPTSFVRLIQRCDLVLRTTNTDGDAISIRESLYYRKPVLASDVVRRPKATMLFKNRDFIDLAHKIASCMAHRGEKMQSACEPIDYKTLYINIYNC